MSYNVLTIPPFDKQLKRLSNKYPSLKKEMSVLFNALALDPEQGSPLGNGCYKIRVAIASKHTGKSGGARVITNIKVKNKEVYLLSIYDKSDMASMSDTEIEKLLKLLPD